MPATPDRPTKETTLHQGWEFRQSAKTVGFWRPQVKDPGWMQAQVPGNLIQDLALNGVLPDPLTLRHELACQWVGESEWTYRCEFERQPAGHRTAVLKFACLDTLCTVHLNGSKVAASENYFVPLQIDVSKVLQTGTNSLELRFASSVNTGLQRRTAYCEKHGIDQALDYLDERAFVRMPGHFFAWDWGPRLVGCGIRGPVTLTESDASLQDLSVHVESLREGVFRVTAQPVGCEADLTLALGPGASLVQGSPGDWTVQGGLWWPAGLGPPTLHTVTAKTPDGHTLTKQIGLRTIDLQRNQDEIGESFTFIVNGTPVNARGANYVSEHATTHQKVEDLRKDLALCRDLNFNMLRVWGGGGYASDDFYQACDELGILVWQDFPFACMYYPDDPEWQTVIEAEARHNLHRIRHRPSLALLCGNNENLTMWLGKWSAGGPLPDRYMGEELYDRVLPKAVQETCPHVPYIASSPIGSDPESTVPDVNMGRFGDSHFWEVWHGKGDWSNYTASDTRFSSEFGFASCCGPNALDQMLGGNPQDPWPTLLHHDKTGKDWEFFKSLVALHYPQPQTLEDWMFSSLLNQRDALRFGIEHFRRLNGCQGTLIWQWNDVWPAQSWAVQDWSGDLKPAAYELKRLYAPVMVGTSHLPGSDRLTAFVVNDGPPATVTVLAETFDLLTGATKTVQTQRLDLPTGAKQDAFTMHQGGLDTNNQAVRLSIAEDPRSSRLVLLTEPKDTPLQNVDITASATGHTLELRPQGPVVDLCAWCPRSQVSYPGWPGTGMLPFSGTGPFTLQVSGDPKTVVARSIAGRHRLVWE